MLSGYIGKATTAGSHAVAPHSAHADVELRLDRHPGRAPGERRHSELPAHTQWCRRPANRSPHPWHCSRAEELESDKPGQRGACFQAPRGASALYCLSPRVSCLSEEATDPLPRPTEHHLAGSNGSDSRKVPRPVLDAAAAARRHAQAGQVGIEASSFQPSQTVQAARQVSLPSASSWVQCLWRWRGLDGPARALMSFPQLKTFLKLHAGGVLAT